MLRVERILCSLAACHLDKHLMCSRVWPARRTRSLFQTWKLEAPFCLLSLSLFSQRCKARCPERVLFLIAYYALSRAVTLSVLATGVDPTGLQSHQLPLLPPLPAFSLLTEPHFCSDIWHGATSREGGSLPGTLGCIVAGSILGQCNPSFYAIEWYRGGYVTHFWQMLGQVC